MESNTFKEIGDVPQPRYYRSLMLHILHFNFRNFVEWMYPANGGSEKVGEAALGVIILWFCWYVRY